MSKLVIFLPDAGEVTHDLTAARITVGRTQESDLCLSDASVSVRHAELIASGSSYQLRDLGSTNGIRVNGKPVTEALLAPGDRVRFGSIEGVFEPDAAQRSAAPLPQQTSQPASQSQKPSDFGNASPFRRKIVQKDSVKTAALAAGAAALAFFLISLLFILGTEAPKLPWL